MGITNQSSRRSPAASLLFLFGPLRSIAAGPHRGARLHPDTVAQLHHVQGFAKRRVISIGRIGQHHHFGHTRGFGGRVCAWAISSLVANSTSSGTPAFARRGLSSAHSCGRYKRQAIGTLPRSEASDKLTAT